MCCLFFSILFICLCSWLPHLSLLSLSLLLSLSVYGVHCPFMVYSYYFFWLSAFFSFSNCSSFFTSIENVFYNARIYLNFVLQFNQQFHYVTCIIYVHTEKKKKERERESVTFKSIEFSIRTHIEHIFHIFFKTEFFCWNKNHFSYAHIHIVHI